MPARLLASVIFVLTVLCSSVAGAALPTDCLSPRRAVDSVFAWQRPDNLSLRMASMCLDRAGRDEHELKRLAERIVIVFDKRLAYVDLQGLSDDPTWSPPDGTRSFAPHPKVPGVMLTRTDDGSWQWTRASLDRINDLYESDVLLDDVYLSRIPKVLQGEVLGVALWQYLALLVVFLVGLILRKVLQVFIESRIKSLAVRLGRSGAERLVDVVASPGATLIMAVVVHFAYPYLRLRIEAAMAVAVAVRMIVVLSLVWAVYRAVDIVAARLAHNAKNTDSRLDDQLVPLIRKSLKVMVVIMGVLFVLQNLNVNVGSLLAGLGIGGLAFALAAKDTLANLFGSVMIFSDRPFQVGDWVKIGSAEGIVEEVGFRSSRIRTFYNSVLSLPNAKIVDTPIDNMGARIYRRVFTTINIEFDTTPEQVQAFVEGIRAILRANPHTRKDYYEVHMSGISEHSLEVMLYFFFKVPSWTDELRERHNVFLEVMRLARALGVRLSFPSRTLRLAPSDGARAPGELPEPTSSSELADVVRGFGPEGERARPNGPRITNGFLASS
ncbi:MAG: mechanosensitive ion channel family protein [Labilithrix sp.]|nr:mechanosensitive ion channel family protein [Labilithrix sp.]